MCASCCAAFRLHLTAARPQRASQFATKRKALNEEFTRRARLPAGLAQAGSSRVFVRSWVKAQQNTRPDECWADEARQFLAYVGQLKARERQPLRGLRSGVLTSSARWLRRSMQTCCARPPSLPRRRPGRHSRLSRCPRSRPPPRLLPAHPRARRHLSQRRHCPRRPFLLRHRLALLLRAVSRFRLPRRCHLAARRTRSRHCSLRQRPTTTRVRACRRRGR